MSILVWGCTARAAHGKVDGIAKAHFANSAGLGSLIASALATSSSIDEYWSGAMELEERGRTG